MSGYVVNTKAEQKEMLKAMNMESLDDLYVSVPPQAKAKDLDLPEGRSELEVAAEMDVIAGKNKTFRHIFRGAGSYHHFIPAIVKSVTSKEDFLTDVCR